MNYLSKINISNVKYIGQKRAEALTSEGIATVKDLLEYYPRRYLDRQTLTKISQFSTSMGGEVTFIAKLYTKDLVKTKKKFREILTAKFSDGSGIVEGKWFNFGKSVAKKLVEGEEYIISGRVEYFGGWQMAHPVVEPVDKKENTGAIIPLYPMTQSLRDKGVDSWLIRRAIKEAHKNYSINIEDVIPEKIVDELGLMLKSDAVYQIHFPEDSNRLKEAMYRLKFEESFYFQLVLARRKQVFGDAHKECRIHKAGELVNKLNDILSFELTDAQKRVVREIFEDLKSEKPMNRLIQGDVGSGKTIVALFAILMVLDRGFQAAIMAPTEILAEQHYRNFKNLCENLDINISLLVGKMRAKLKREVLGNIAQGVSQIVVGTHALIQDDVEFHKLGLVIVDEQHRFGVHQRGTLIKKAGDAPNILVMTATPIPRTMTLSVYGDLDVSIIDELPKGRQVIKTAIRRTSELHKVYSFIKSEVKNGRQAYIVYPLIDDSEKLDLKAATTSFEELQSGIFKGLRCGLLHGRMKSEEKDATMDRFKNKEIDILISTTVIEVGVDVPNATVMLIMSSERFGLAQLHQLRGRVGRGKHQSYCILNVSNDVSEESLFRLKVVEKTNDGFKIAEEDFNIRGPGEFFGERQSGDADFKLLNLLRDRDIIEKSRDYAFNLVFNDNVTLNYKQLVTEVNSIYSNKKEFLDIS